MLCLRTDHTLSMLCLNTFLTLKICDGPVFDFSVIEHDADHCEILFLTYLKDNCATYILRVISYPGKRIIFICKYFSTYKLNMT